MIRSLAAALALVAAVPRAHGVAPEPAALTLEEALRQLDAQNLTLAQARSRANEARAVVRQAMAGFLPTAGLGGSYLRNSAEAKMSIGAMLDSIEGGLNAISPRPVTLDRSRVPGDVVIQPLDAWTGSASLRVPLFAGNAYQDWRAAQEAVKVAEASVEVAGLQLRSALRQSAHWAAAAEEIAAASERALGIAQEHEKSSARNVQAGVAAPLAHLQAQTEVVRRENDVARTRAEKERAWLALGVLLGKAEPVRVTVPASAAIPHDAPEALAADAFGRRPEVRVQQAQIRAAERQLESAWWRLTPQLSASFSAVASTSAFPTGEKTGWKAGLDLSWTLYDGGLRYGKRAQAEAQIVTAQAALQAQKLEIGQQVRDAARDVDVAEERLRLAQRQKELAQEVYATARRSFDAGLASSLDVLDANDRLYQADVGVADARARIGMAQVSLARAAGANP